MVQALRLIRNVGKFDSVNDGANLPFGKVTLIYAENGHGKTTISAILRSLSSGDADPILERHRLGAPHPPHVVVELENGRQTSFQHGVWSETCSDIAVFDDAFVADNVCSGTEIETRHRQKLHELIVGAQGVTLHRDLQDQVALIEEHNTALRVRAAEIPSQQRGSYDVDEFCSLVAVPNIEARITDAKRQIRTAEASAPIATKPSFSKIEIPPIDISALQSFLDISLEGLESTALSRAQTHIEAIGREAESWIAEGLRLVDKQNEVDPGIDKGCPFCAQSLEGSSLVAHYRAFFSDEYKSLKSRIEAAIQRLEARHGGEAQAAFERSVREVGELCTFWKEFTDLPDIAIDTAQVAREWKEARDLVLKLLSTKRSAPLEPISLREEDRRILEVWNRRCSTVALLSDELLAQNQDIEVVKERAKEAELPTLKADLLKLRATEARFQADVDHRCRAYLTERTAKLETEQRRDAAKTALDAYRTNVFPQYGDAINDFLKRLNAPFRLGKVKGEQNRGGSSAKYDLEIGGHAVALVSKGATPQFRNTLSAGDRNTLALAFFFASIRLTPDRSRKIVVLDDPMTSLDEHRTFQTLQEINALSQDICKIVILSHSKPFLLQAWERLRQVQKTPIRLGRSKNGSRMASWDIEQDQITEHDRRYLKALSYLDNSDPENARSVASSLRPMLESYARIAYPHHFPPGTLLGPFFERCRTLLGTSAEIMDSASTTELRALLDFGNRFHHESNPTFATEHINDAELADYVGRTIAFMQRP